MPLAISSGLHVRFSGAYIENLKGRLLTSVHRDSKKQHGVSYYLTLQTDFQQGRLEIEFTFLANGYPLKYVQYLLQQFLQRHPSPKNSFSFNKSSYDTFRRDIFPYYNARLLQSMENGSLLLEGVGIAEGAAYSGRVRLNVNGIRYR
ncbi:unnamed protein product [Adineta ricciae]|uniref:Uncharacterized protein n=1 Tax=Adineta ricciae TaxID=249248 RepID=A0A815E6Y2_ADIRI|nr:unnamed protein product [Adineta ricciae]CAF1594706.1 unnamed protein product [Adineta ricciae]